MHALLAVVLAQACTALLPAPEMEIEWFRDGRPHARDVPVRATATERVYRRRQENGRATERVVACTATGGVSYFTDRVGSAAPVRIPVPMERGSTRVVGRSTVRRIEPPTGGSSRALWYSISSPGVSVYGLERGAGVVEIRTPAAAGGVSVLRAVVRPPVAAQAPADPAVADTMATVLEQRVAELERTVRTLTDSIHRLLARPSPPLTAPAPPSPESIPEFLAADVYVERGEYDDALAVLLRARSRLTQWSDSAGTRHRALDRVHERLVDTLSRCAAARGATESRRRAPRCAIDD